MPTLPSWDTLHPIIIHFPIALLLVAPLAVFAGFWRQEARGLTAAALGLMGLGTAAAFVAASTGKSAMELVTRTDLLGPTLDRHADMAEKIPWIFLILGILYVVMLFAARRSSWPKSPLFQRTIHAIFVALYIGGAVWLMLAAHQGGLLVHHFGVHALI